MASSPQWLTTEQQQIWRSYLHATAQLSSFLDSRLRQFGLSLSEYEVLVTLSETSEWRLRMSELATQVHQSRSRLTHTIARLEGSGLVQRSSCNQDGRGVWAELTQKGFDLLESAAPDHVAAVRHALVDAASVEDFSALGRVLSAVLDRTSAP